MKFAIPVFALAVASTVPVIAQDSTVTTRTKTKADDTRTVTMIGCVREDPLTHTYTLVGTMAAVDPLKSKTKVEDRAVGTTGSMTTYPLLSPAEVELSTYVGRRVDLSAVKTQSADSAARSKAKGDLRDAEYTVVSVKPLPGTCSTY